MDTGNLALLMIIIVSLGLFAMIFGIMYLRNKERMAMIERGMNPEIELPKLRQNNSSISLTTGFLLIGSGLGLFIAYMINHFALADNDNPAIFFALIAIFGGIGLLISYFIENKANKQKEL
ncbi:DUF6249 domain-containing protein [uncultured Mucilaginibacter sp.]|uniref:DUF6249 domain-containing protein n=1 Tax=uncultured Mucilaginibacter sp. TaxID=797541 RepID=UPI00260A756F|nr:DUF6249 domain-containing protein [uncultured Mucilaginibacter sp.]